jgi:hypothetical protein
MKPRIKKGTLVCSTNSFRYILSKRLVVEVRYTFKKGIVNEKIVDVRQTLLQ